MSFGVVGLLEEGSKLVERFTTGELFVCCWSKEN
jgi:hypothetical protein